jgi:hypothetical protein
MVSNILKFVLELTKSQKVIKLKPNITSVQIHPQIRHPVDVPTSLMSNYNITVIYITTINI